MLTCSSRTSRIWLGRIAYDLHIRRMKANFYRQYHFMRHVLVSTVDIFLTKSFPCKLYAETALHYKIIDVYFHSQGVRDMQNHIKGVLVQCTSKWEKNHSSSCPYFNSSFIDTTKSCQKNSSYGKVSHMSKPGSVVMNFCFKKHHSLPKWEQ